MKSCLSGLILLAVGTSGCFDMDELANSERKPVTPPGIAPVDQMDGIDPAPANNSANGNGSGQVANTPPVQQTRTIPRVPAKMVDKARVMGANPDLVVVQTGVDPISVAGGTRVGATTRLESRSFAAQVKQFQATNGRFPTFEEYMQQAKQSDVRFNSLPPYQAYGYDVRTGTVDVLEDSVEKKKQYEAAGIPLDE